MPVNFDLTGKVAVITGAGAGIGRALARGFGKAGATLALADVDEGGLAETVAGLETQVSPLVTRLDVSNSGEVAAFAREVETKLGPADILICNAGIYPRAYLLEMSEEEWDRVINVNLKGAFLGARHFGPAMAKRGGGRIIVMSSSAGFQGSPRGVHYSASKAGLVGFAKALAVELAPYQITVNAIAPGLTDTAQPRYGMSEAEIAERAQTIPLGRIGQPEDVVNAALWLASEGASFVTGQTIHVNGGAFRI